MATMYCKSALSQLTLVTSFSIKWWETNNISHRIFFLLPSTKNILYISTVLINCMCFPEQKLKKNSLPYSLRQWYTNFFVWIGTHPLACSKMLNPIPKSSVIRSSVNCRVIAKVIWSNIMNFVSVLLHLCSRAKAGFLEKSFLL